MIARRESLMRFLSKQTSNPPETYHYTLTG